MRRREFISLIGGAASWPVAARAAERANAPHWRSDGRCLNNQARLAVFRERLQQLGWVDGGNVRIDFHWTGGSAAETRKHAAELAALAPDVILTTGSAGTRPMVQATNINPYRICSCSRSCRCRLRCKFVSTRRKRDGFHDVRVRFEWQMVGTQEIAPSVTRAGILRDPAITAGIGQFTVLQSAASLVRIEVSPVSLGGPTEIEQAIAAFASSPNGGMVLTASALSAVHHNLIISLAARYKLPTVYYEKYHVADGGLISYGPVFIEQFGRAADYVDRILKGAKPADLPVQAPVKYELAINMKTARALGLDVPPTLLARADEVIE